MHWYYEIDSQTRLGDAAKSSHLQFPSDAVPLGVSMRRIAWVTALLAFTATSALADDPSFTITLKNNQFMPSEVQIPAGVKVKLVVRNENATTSEFESNQFHREKVVTPGQEVTVFVGPLDPGSYEFFDDLHPQTRGHLNVK
jgi:plastocyanin